MTSSEAPGYAAPVRPPEGTLALLFTDMEGSTRLAAVLGPAWAAVVADHEAIVGGAIAAEGGFVDGIEGDAFFATFADARAGARAAVAALEALRSHRWPEPVGDELRVRMGLHVGHVERLETRYVGLEVHRAARVASAAHGGQLLLTAAARAMVGDEIATEPLGTHRLKDFPLPEPLFCAVVGGRGAAAFPPPRTQEVRPTNLPAGTPFLVGRDAELERVRAALLADGERLVTLTGRGGAGKTSLALAAAASLLDEHPGGVWLTRLAMVSAPEDVLGAIVTTLGTELDPARPALETLAGRLGERGPALLVLDNLEHLTGAAPQLAAVLDALPHARVLATSQVPLRLPAERVLTLDALDEASGLALVARVAERRGAALAAAGDRAALLDIVRLLDGLPLALELAAARLALLSPAQLRDRLLASPDVLKDTGAGRPERHRSLRATVDWTLGLLDDGPRTLFTRLGAFAGPVELEEIEAVAGADGLDVLEALAGLRDVALVRRVESGDGRVRFGLPEALRQIAAGRLDAAPDGEAWRRAHAQRQLDIAWPARRLAQATGPAYRAALDADAEADAALRWARAAGDEAAAPLAAARASLLADNGRTRETFAIVDDLLAGPPLDATVAAQAHIAHAYALLNADRMDESLAAAERARAQDADPATHALATMLCGIVRTFRGEHEQAVAECARASVLARGLDASVLAGVLLIEAQARMFGGDVEAARALLAEGERIGEGLDVVRLWDRETFRGDLAMHAGRPLDALPHYARSLETAEARGDDFQILMDLQGVACALAAAQLDAEAIEAIGLAEAQGEAVAGSNAVNVARVLGGEALAASEERLGPDAVTRLRAQARAVAAGSRVVRACRLARGVESRR